MNYLRILIAGIAATAAMSVYMVIIHFAKLPETSVGIFLGLMAGNSALGWVIHFLAGIAFAYIYILFFNRWLPIENNISRGAIYSLLMFIGSMAALQILFAAIHFGTAMRENLSLAVFTNIIGYLIYGSVLGAFFTKKVATPITEIEDIGHTHS